MSPSLIGGASCLPPIGILTAQAPVPGAAYAIKFYWKSAMTFKPHHDPIHLYFVTATVLGWKHLFIEPAYAEIIFQSLDFHRRHGRWLLFVFALMPNHVHFIIRPLGGQTISTVLQSFGSYTAHTILDRLRQDGRTDLLTFFSHRQNRDTDKQHQIWLPIEAKNVFSVEFLHQKVEYVHNNPIAKHWHLVDDRADYFLFQCVFLRSG
jgi:putative transposase